MDYSKLGATKHLQRWGFNIKQKGIEISFNVPRWENPGDSQSCLCLCCTSHRFKINYKFGVLWQKVKCSRGMNTFQGTVTWMLHISLSKAWIWGSNFQHTRQCQSFPSGTKRVVTHPPTKSPNQLDQKAFPAFLLHCFWPIYEQS